MSGPLAWSRDPDGPDDYPWQLPFRDAVRHLRLGSWDVRVLDQDRVWVDAAGTVHRIQTLSDDHLANVIVLLRHRAADIVLDYTVAAEFGRFTPRTPLPPTAVGAGRIARNWVGQTRLWDALQAEVRLRADRRRTTAQVLDPKAGGWVVRTENSGYLLDFARGRAMRLPDQAAGGLRRDGAWAVLHAIGPIRVGHPMTLQLTVTDDPAVAGTTRTTSPVIAIHPLAAPPDATPADLVGLARAATRPARVSEPEPIPLTEYRTAAFIAAAGDICAFWAVLTVLLTRHQATAALIVPSRMRDPHADDASADLLVEQCPGSVLHELEREVQDAVGWRLRVTTLSDYPGSAFDELADHAVPLSPGWPLAAHDDSDAPRRDEA